jgi:hypothetical protein
LPFRVNTTIELTYIRHYRHTCHSIVVLTPNGNFWVRPLLYSVSDMHGIIYAPYDVTPSKMASMRLVSFPAWTPTIQIDFACFTQVLPGKFRYSYSSKTPPRPSTSFPVQHSLSVLPADGTSSATLKASINIPNNNTSKHHNPFIYSSENSKSHRRKEPTSKVKTYVRG